MIRSIWVWFNALFATLTIAGSVVIASMLRIDTKLYDWAPRGWSIWILWAAGVRVVVEGVENVHMNEPQVFASNHQSWFDVFALSAVIPKRYRFVAKKELERIPIFGRAWKAAGHISIDRGDRGSAIRSLELGGELIRRDNSSVVIFPEGTRSWDGALLPFKKGAFMLALHTGVDIVPVGIFGSRSILPKGGWRLRSGTIIVHFGKPIVPANYVNDRESLIADVRAEVQELMAAPEQQQTIGA